MIATIWETIFFNPLLNLMILLYDFFGNNLGLAILGIAVIARLIMIPLTKKQTTMTKKMASLKPELDKLQKKYGENKEKLAQEQVKLYKKVGYNPLGCLGTFVPQLLILSVLIGVIRAVTNSNLEGLYPWVVEMTGIAKDSAINTKFLFWELTTNYNAVSAEFGKFSLEALPYIALSILVGITQYFTTIFTQKMQQVSTPKKKEVKKKVEKTQEQSMEEMQEKMQKSTMLLFPIMTAFFTISMPAALGWYWMLQSLLLIIQYLSLDFDKTKKGIQNLLDVLQRKK
jgi:YidC/Oxa1 family membrane protein insertase